MAEDEPGRFSVSIDEPTGSKDRATVRLVLSEVGRVGEMVQGHKELTKQGFENVQRQLDDVRGLPTKVTELEQRFESLVEEVDELKKRWAGRLEYRRVNLPVIALTAISVALAILEFATKFIH